MSQVSTFNVKVLAGSASRVLPATTSVFTTADILVDRSVSGGLDSLSSSDTVTVAFLYSLDGGSTFNGCGGATWQGGPLPIVKGVPDESEELAIGMGQPFPVGTVFRFDTNATASVRLSATVTYS